MGLPAELEFLPDFKFGVNLGSPYQIEGASPFTDHYTAGMRRGTPTISQGWWTNPELFKADIQLAKRLGISIVRFGLEWARINPQLNIFNEGVISRYGDMVKFAKDQGLSPMLTLNHFTLPQHIARQGGWTNFQTSVQFAQAVEKVFLEVGGVQITL